MLILVVLEKCSSSRVFPAPGLPSAVRQRPENLDPAAENGFLHHKISMTDSRRLPINGLLHLNMRFL